MWNNLENEELQTIAPNCKFIPQGFLVEDDLRYLKQYIMSKLERAGRVCYHSEDKITKVSAAPFLRGILKRGHESVIEHQAITVRFITSRGILAEITRHRLAAFSVESTRYCDYSKNAVEFICPESYYPMLKQNQYATRLYILSCQQTAQAYLELRKQGIPPEEARDVLNQALKTEIVMTANIREWRHIFKLRTTPAAHPQIRDLLLPVLKYFQEMLPILFEDIQPN